MGAEALQIDGVSASGPVVVAKEAPTGSPRRLRGVYLAAAPMAIGLGIALALGALGTATKHHSTASALLLATDGQATRPAPLARVAPDGSGWALSTAGLELTTDEGRSFLLARPPLAPARIDDVAVAGGDVTVAAVSGGSVQFAASHDGGATWTAIAPSGGSGNAGFGRLVTEGGRVIGMLATDISSSNFSFGEWYSSPDNGRTWAHHRAPSGGVVTAAGGKLWLVGGPTNSAVYTSADLGRTWTSVSIPSAAAATGAGLSVPGALSNGDVVLVATTPNAPGAATAGLTIYVSSDLGASWKVLASTSFSGSVGEGVTTPSSLVGDTVWLGTPTTVFVLSATGSLATVSARGLPPGAALDSINAISDSSAWATATTRQCSSGKTSCVSTTTLLKSADGGRTWSPVNLGAARSA